MNKRQYNFLLYRILCFLMAFHVINISLDTPDRLASTGRATAYHKDLSVNKIESIGEFILETCLEITNAIPEHDDPDDDSEFAELEKDYVFVHLFIFTPLMPSIHYLTTDSLPFPTVFLPAPVSEIIAPPPQVYA
ncbi:hypothetical protein [Spirosoma radiotolerans]|uniref:Uncharacterized protein n=1 Tax=Spirosoma radiotolerans TaxID=1379870 RepID=A0A0E3V7L6_9BACT|nr:hypothetical protein [Spirosoma radiotolerans]AKD55536.1 hypothetical protein SD10_12105 [Spirosoma radiotolerans]